MNWDLEVDMVATDSGVAGLATAISAVDFGGEVFVASSSGRGALSESGIVVSSHAEGLQPALGGDTSDSETNAYLAALSSDLGPFRRSTWDVDVPICVVQEPPVESGRIVAPVHRCPPPRVGRALPGIPVWVPPLPGIGLADNHAAHR